MGANGRAGSVRAKGLSPAALQDLQEATKAAKAAAAAATEAANAALAAARDAQAAADRAKETVGIVSKEVVEAVTSAYGLNNGGPKVGIIPAQMPETAYNNIKPAPAPPAEPPPVRLAPGASGITSTAEKEAAALVSAAAASAAAAEAAEAAKVAQTSAAAAAKATAKAEAAEAAVSVPTAARDISLSRPLEEMTPELAPPPVPAATEAGASGV